MRKKLVIGLLSLFATTTPSLAAIDMTVPIVDDYGVVMKDPTYKPAPGAPHCESCEILTVGKVISLALRGIYEDEKTLPWQDSFNRGAMAAALRDNKAAVLDATELATIESLITKGRFAPPIVYQVISHIDPGAKPTKLH
jgi:hypothetical protein